MIQQDIDKLNPDEVKELFGSDGKKGLTFRQRQDLKNGEPGVSGEIQSTIEIVLKENKELLERLETQSAGHASEIEKHDASMNELIEKIQDLTNENLELGGKLQHAELMLSELRQIQEEENKTVDQKLTDHNEAKEVKAPVKSPNPRRK